MFTKVESQFWRDEKIKPADDDIKLVMLYLFTSPHRNLIGFYYLPIGYACDDLNWKPERFLKAIEWLVVRKRISYDRNSSIVLVQNYFKFNPLENPNQIKSAIDKLNELPYNECLSAFDKACMTFYHERMKPLLERLRERYTKQEEVEEEVEVKEEVEGEEPIIPPPPSKPLPIPYKEITEAFNIICVSLPKIAKVTDSRKAKIKTRFAELKNLGAFEEIFNRAENSDFLTNKKGANKNNFKATFDWLMDNDSNYTKVLEGNYDNVKGGTIPTPSTDKKDKLKAMYKKFEEEEQGID